jgi:Arc/MetJ-type ribon-helix-helix transcriptional regulator
MDVKLRKDRRYTVRVDRKIEAFFDTHPYVSISDFIRTAIKNEIAGFNEQDYERMVKYVH